MSFVALNAFSDEGLEPTMLREKHTFILSMFTVTCNTSLQHQAKITTISLDKFFPVSQKFVSTDFGFLGRLITMSLSSFSSKKVLSTLCKFP